MSSDLNDSTFAADLQLDLPAGLRNAEEAHAVAKAMAAQAWACDESEFELICASSVFVPQRLLLKGVPLEVYQMHKAEALRKTKHRGLIVLFLAALLILGVWFLMVQLHKQHETRLKLLTETTARLQSLKQSHDRRQVSSSAQERQWKEIGPKLELDINPVFNTIENIREPRVRLRSLELETTTHTATLVYELVSLEQVGSLHNALSKQDSDMSCRLMGIQSVTQTVSAQWLCSF